VLDVAIFGFGRLAGWWSGSKVFANIIYHDPTWVILPGRLAMVCFALWSIWLTYKLASDLTDRRTGTVAALLVAVNPLYIAWSQVIRSDIMAICFMLLVMRASIRVARDGKRADTLLASLWLGIAIITKWPFAVTGMAFAGALALRLRGGKGTLPLEFRRLLGFGVMTIVFALMASPFILLDYPTLIRNLEGEAQLHHLGASGGTPLENAWWYLRGPIFSGLGWLGAVLTLGGGFALARANRQALWIVYPIPVVFFLLFSLQRLIWERWALPLVPVLAICAAFGLFALARFAKARFGTRPAQALMLVIVAATVVPLLLQNSENTRVRTHDTRQIATAWVEQHIPRQSTILIEHFGFDLLNGPYQFRFPLGDSGCVDVRDMLAGKIQYDQIEAARNQRSNVDYGTLNPAMRGTCASQYAVLTQYDRYREEKAYFPQQYAAYRDLMAGSTILATIAPVPGRTGGPMIRIVRLKHAAPPAGGTP
jgi:hypothetical protein